MGSFGGPIGPGQGDAIAQAMARRQMGGSPTAASSMTQQPVPSQIPQGAGAAIPSGAPQAPTAGQSAGAPIAGLPPMPAESELIVKALDSRLRSLSKLQGA